MAVKRLYGDNFDQMIKMFETNGAENFPRSVATVINSAIDYLEQQQGGLALEQAAEVGMDLMMKVLEDVISEKVVPDVTLEQVQQVLPATLVMYADARPDVSKEDVQAVMQEIQAGVAAQEGGEAPPEAMPGEPQANPNAPLSTGPKAPPGNTPVPPGVTI